MHQAHATEVTGSNPITLRDFFLNMIYYHLFCVWMSKIIILFHPKVIRPLRQGILESKWTPYWSESNRNRFLKVFIIWYVTAKVSTFFACYFLCKVFIFWREKNQYRIINNFIKNIKNSDSLKWPTVYLDRNN